ncbi:MAG: 2-phospho-L-lactate transferase [Anaerolineaceae bacterium]|nr:2-phospho-L-lactate transferase [Anaerolineaceae bacterium]
MDYKVVALAGGVGGAKLAHGLYQALEPDHLSVIVNIGDDFVYYGLNISPDLDTVCYNLAGMAHRTNGWGLDEDSNRAMEQARRLGGDDWFILGDRDLGTHLVRTQQLNSGKTLSMVTRDFCSRWGIRANIIPMSDDQVHTKVLTKQGQSMDFQEYFVHQKCEPEVKGFHFEGLKEAAPAPGIDKIIHDSDLVVICPSNPWVSINPILSLQPIKEALMGKPVIAVSPLIGGNAVKGPLSKMYMELGIIPSCQAVSNHYRGIIKGMLIDQVDNHEKEAIEAFGIITYATDLLMNNDDDRKRLAVEALNFGKSLSIIP